MIKVTMATASRWPKVLLLGLLVAACLIGCLNATGASGTTEPDGGVQSARARLILPALFNFNRFKRAFNKYYQSPSEEMYRCKLFTSRAIRAFISGLKYKLRRLDFYLAINPMSDRTMEEVSKTHLRHHKRQPSAGESKDDAQESVETNLDEEQELVKLDEDLIKLAASKSRQDPTIGQFLIGQESAHVAEASEQSKQSEAAEVRRLKLEDLIRDTSEPETPEQPTDEVPSNNPNYAPPLERKNRWRPHRNHSITMNTQVPRFSRGTRIIRRSPLPGRPGATASNNNTNTNNAVTRSTSYVLIKLLQRSLESLAGSLGASLRSPDEVYVDHRSSRCLLAPRGQGECGSCALFAMMALYEWLYCTESGSLVAFSEQYGLDCGELGEEDGCDGAEIHKVVEFSQQFGLELRSYYPYSAKSAQCPYGRGLEAKKMGYLRADNVNYKLLRVQDFESELERAPIVVTLATTDHFHEYGGGVDKARGCKEEGAHAMLLVGHGREDGKDYWLFRNSYGVKFGESGYYKLNKSSARRCILDDAGWTLEGTFTNKARNQHYDSKHVLLHHYKHLLEQPKLTGAGAR